MAKHSNVVNYNSPDGLPSNPVPLKVSTTRCGECFNIVAEPVCPHCGADVDVELEPDYEAGDREYNPEEDD